MACRQHIGGRFLILLILAAVFSVLSCRESPAEPSGASPSASQPRGQGLKPPAPSPGELVSQLREYHRLRQYHKIEDLVVPDRRPDLIRLLSAVDRLLAANRQAVQIIRRTCLPAVTARWDLVGVADSLGIFSQNVSVVDTTYQEPAAIVHYQIAGGVPLRKAEFLRQDGRWLYRPDTVAGLPELIEQLASALNQLASALEQRPFTEQEIDHEYKARILPIIDRMEKKGSG